MEGRKILNFTGTTKRLLLIYPSMGNMNLKERINIMVTPQFYTLKKEVLPVKYAYQAKKIAPSLFEGLLEEGASYEYMVFKENDIWTFIAYDIEKISDFLISKGIDKAMVSKLFFAEQAKENLTSALPLGEKDALVLLDDTVVVVPQTALSEEESFLSFGKEFTPKKGISLQGEMGSVLNKKQAYMFAALFLLFAGLFIAEGARYGDGKAGEKELQTLYASHPSLQSSYTREGVVKKYRDLDTQERKKRDSIKDLSSIIFKGVTLTSLHVDDKKFKAMYVCVSAQVSKKLQELAKKFHYSVKPVKNSFNVEIEGTI